MKKHYKKNYKTFWTSEAKNSVLFNAVKEKQNSKANK